MVTQWPGGTRISCLYLSAPRLGCARRVSPMEREFWCSLTRRLPGNTCVELTLRGKTISIQSSSLKTIRVGSSIFNNALTHRLSIVIPTNISIQTQPYFPLVNGVITVRTLAVTLSCAYVAHPLPGFVKMYSDMPITKTGEYGHTIESRLDYTEHLKEYYVTCYVNNGIARLHMINVIVDLCKCVYHNWSVLIVIQY